MDYSNLKGAQIYTPLALKLYDWWVLGISNRYAWRCSTQDVLLNHFVKYLGEKHLDIGVGTGFYLSKASAANDIFLMDLNHNSLNSAGERIGSSRITHRIKHDVFEAFPDEHRNKYDSVSMFYLLHCLPGPFEKKTKAIVNAADALNDKGTLYGATILGHNAGHNAFGKKLMNVYNKKGIFSNESDSAEQIHHCLSNLFEKVEVSTTGVVATFSASGRK